MNGTRILRYIGNREKPEVALYANPEILHDWPLMPLTALALMEEMALEVKGLSGIKPFNRFEPGGFVAFSLVEEVVADPRPNGLFPGAIPDYAFVTTPAPTFQNVQRKPKPKPEEKDFEVNLVEPLQGWKAWSFNGVRIVSAFDESQWLPLQPFEAQCSGGCKKIPAEHHTCGIYAISLDQENAGTHINGHSVIGEVYGWGRYIRGSSGWRAEFAYPKCFFLANNQKDWIPALKEYQVPIFVFEPIQRYDPQDGGYENAHWENPADGNLGAGEESGSAESDDEIPF